jgi:hypothetical protein
VFRGVADSVSVQTRKEKARHEAGLNIVTWKV